MLVMKFGGTSVGSAEAIRGVKEIVAQARAKKAPVVVVVSAMSTITETLLAAARGSVSGDTKTAQEKLNHLEKKHLDTVDALFSNGTRKEAAKKIVSDITGEFRRICSGMELLGELPLRAMDAGLSVGERLSANLVALFLEQEGIAADAVDSCKCVVTDDNFGGARLLMEPTREATRSLLLPLTQAGRTPIVTGFLGATREGIRTTLGRGGSDYSGAILAAALDADELWIWTDVDGVLSADPKAVSDARILDEVSYEEASELSHFGAKVLHHKTLAPLASRMIPVWIKNTFAPDKPGTRIGPPHPGMDHGAKAVTSLAPVTMFTLRSNGTPGTTELFARTFTALHHAGVEILMVTQSSYQDNFCLLVPKDAAEAALEALSTAFRLELNHNYVEPITQQDVAAIALIGEGMRGTRGIASTLFGSLAKEQINIIAIAQGSSESNISLAVDTADKAAAIKAIHDGCIAPFVKQVVK
jgi:bifunctional aspartokinase / homoserine dehydrogenase 1